ncbi:MAG: flagellar basal body rod protein FlgC [Bryobacter sp.]|jgi:flagellar basal-body rod protein FlgC|nr:flagellar basal body rod protein FlgC [Bryobacter sp. CoA8 C33]
MSLFNSLSVSASGMSAQRFRAELLAQNIANSETTRTEEGGPYRHQDAIFQVSDVKDPFSSAFQSSFDGPRAGVSVQEILIDDKEPIRRYLPGHPDADEKGYVSFPNFSPVEEMVDLMNANRSFSANVTAMNAVKDMISKSIELVRG